jgi:hypothetical protein
VVSNPAAPILTIVAGARHVQLFRGETRQLGVIAVCIFFEFLLSSHPARFDGAAQEACHLLCMLEAQLDARLVNAEAEFGNQLSPVNSHNEWDPLEEIIVGRLEGATMPSDHPVVTCNIPNGAAARAQSLVER